MKTKNIITTLTLAIQLTFAPLVNAAVLPVRVQATDAVAGYPAALKTSLINPNQDVRFVVEKPDGSVIQIPSQADLDGVAEADLFGHQTKLAGDYRAAVVYPGSADASPQTLFKVYPDQVSPTQSTVRSTLQLVEATKDSSFVVVTLFDQYRNPIANHRIKLLSSRSDDEIEILQEGVTDQNGRANFKVSSKYAGVSVFTAMDITANQVLQDREEIVFFSPSVPAQPTNSFTDLFKADIGGDSVGVPGPVSTFSIEGLPANAKVGDQLSLTIVAEDANGNTAKNYTGTILISVPDDENAVLPNNGEYTFKAADQGKFTFDLSLQFSKLGNQVVQVFDKGNFRIAGEQNIEIVSGQSVIPPGGSSDSLMLKTPSDGAELGSQLVVLTGKGNPNINLKIFDNDVKIGDSETDGDGFFSYEATGLQSGPHQFYVMSEQGEVSNSVGIQIDTIAPVINGFETNVRGNALPGESIEIKVQSEPKLETTKIRLQGVEQDLQEMIDQPGNYITTIVAPANNGDFGIDVILIDSLGNKAEFVNRGTIKVSTPEPQNPGQVQGLEGVPEEASIALVWQEVKGSENPIDHYNIYYGTEFTNLNQKIETDRSFAEWSLEGLEAGTQYFIAVKAVDTQGLESEDFSTTIAVTTVAVDLCANLQCGDNGTCSEGACVCDPGWSGLTCNVQDISNPLLDIPTVSSLQALPYSGAVSLSWPSNVGAQAFYYKIFIGFAPGQYSDSIITPNNQTTYTITDLIDGVPYYFAVAALDVNKSQISPVSQAVQATPSASGYRPAASNPNQTVNSGVYYQNQLSNTPKNVEVGPETLWLIFGSVLFAHFWYNRKRKVVQISQSNHR